MATLTGVGNGLGLLIAMIASPASGSLSDRFTNRWGVASGGLSLGVAGFVLLATGTAFGLLFGLPLTYTSSGSNQGLSTSITGDLSTRDHYGRRLGVAVAADGDQLRPTRSGKDLLLSWLAWFRFPPIVAAEGCVLTIVWIVVSCSG